MSHLKKPPTGFAASREGLDEEVFEGFAVGQSFSETNRLFSKLLVGQSSHFGFQFTHLPSEFTEAFDLPGVGGAKENRESSIQSSQYSVDGVGSPFPDFFEQLHVADRS
jgi:hypothetical protein